MAAVFVVALVRVVIYIIAAPNYGYFRDELYYLACGEHPAWGYVDQPPLIAWIAWVLQHTIGVSLYALRLLPMLADVGCIVMTALLARRLGGGCWAMFLAALAVLVAPIFLTLSHLFTLWLVSTLPVSRLIAGNRGGRPEISAGYPRIEAPILRETSTKLELTGGETSVLPNTEIRGTKAMFRWG